jgi:hypothetical protein
VLVVAVVVAGSLIHALQALAALVVVVLADSVVALILVLQVQ